MHGRVLVADDSADGRWIISDMLAHMGLEVTAAENGRVACDLALSAWKLGRAFDLILMDLQMPEIDGLEATALMRSMGYEGNIVALISDCAFRGTHERCIAAGCNACASKPITYEMLLGVMQRHLPTAK